jgi:hypothetical protein
MTDSIVSSVSSLATSAFKSTSTLSSASDPTSERLFLARPRYADKNQQGKDGRGQFAYIKLLTNTALKAAYTSGDLTKREISDSNAKELFGWASDMVSGTGYGKFLLTGVSCQLSEKVQVKEVFGDGEVVYFFGRQPITINLSGVLIDSPDNQWFTDWLRMYSEFFRGTQLAKNYELLQLVLPNMTAVGSMVGMTWSQESGSDAPISFSFQFLVQSMKPSPITGASMVDTSGIKQINFSKVKSTLDKAGMNVLKSQVTKESAMKIIQNPLSSLADKSSALSSIGGGLQGISGSINGAIKSVISGVNNTMGSSLFRGITSALTGVRSSLFSPVYGILSSLTKLLTTVTSGIKKIFSSLTTAVSNILRDITSIAKLATSLISQVKNTPSGLGRYFQKQLSGVYQDYKTAIASVGKAVGSISSKPTTALASLATLHSSGYRSTTPAFLQSSSKSSFSKAILPSGKTASQTKMAVLKASAPAATADHALLNG